VPADRPRVSILINNYNYGRYLAAAIDSALGQSYQPVEVVVVDDGSTDGSGSVIAGYGDAVVPVLQANGGQASAFNSGFAACRGAIICLLDADDVFLPNKVEAVVAGLVATPTAGWLMHALQHVDGDLHPLAMPGSMRPADASGSCDLRPAIRRGQLRGKLAFEGTATSGLCFRRDLLERILPMPEDRLLIDDYLKFAAMALAGGYILDQRLSLQRIHGDNYMTRRPERACAHLATLVATAHWWRRRVPELERFADNLFAMATGMQQALGCSHPALEGRIRAYVGWTEPRRMASIRLRQAYHRLRTTARQRAGWR
jgi:glycosyltransferase involved in cell wall biosynthesis